VKKGARVIINDIDEKVLDQLSQEIKSIGGESAMIIGSSGRISTIEEIVSCAESSFGRLDMVVANAGITTFGGFLDYSTDQLDGLLEVNVKGTFFLAQAAARLMIAKSNRGSILMMSSTTGYQYHKDLVAYGMTKAAIRHLTKALGVELAINGITVNAIAPGATWTERTASIDEDYRRTWEQITPSGRIAQVEDISNAALYLLSHGARHITGQTLVIDGGWTSTSPQP